MQNTIVPAVLLSVLALIPIGCQSTTPPSPASAQKVRIYAHGESPRAYRRVARLKSEACSPDTSSAAAFAEAEAKLSISAAKAGAGAVIHVECAERAGGRRGCMIAVACSADAVQAVEVE